MDHAQDAKDALLAASRISRRGFHQQQHAQQPQEQSAAAQRRKFTVNRNTAKQVQDEQIAQALAVWLTKETGSAWAVHAHHRACFVLLTFLLHRLGDPFRYLGELLRGLGGRSRVLPLSEQVRAGDAVSRPSQERVPAQREL